ncbi:putative phage abortive infection protein [Aeromonas dhakensis]|uniref:putative phage abortive infection protein n=2 Tax=Aeromonas dhakensis TaxID=196024 RepID=UPI0003A08866|nr:putative phage abortive infection protein [Aeromonas dhakensis]
MKKFFSRKLLTTVSGFILFVIMFFIWFTYPTWIVDVKGQNEITASLGLGSFGDSYGALNTLFSGLAFSAVLITLLVQANQLAVTHKELDLTRLEMKEQSKQFEKQTLLMNKQLFEGTFFNLLNSYSGQSNSILSINGEKGNRAWKEHASLLSENLYMFSSQDEDAISFGYVEYVGDLGGEAIISPILMLFKMLETIDQSPLIDNDDKTRYIALIKAHISSAELYVIAVVGMYDELFSGFSDYIEKYSLLDGLSLEFTLPASIFVGYKLSAYRNVRMSIFLHYLDLAREMFDGDGYKFICNINSGEMLCDTESAHVDDIYKVLVEHNYNCILCQDPI